MTRLHLHSFGDDPTSILLLHGLGSAGPVWWRVAEALADDGHSCLAPDLRGHGESPPAVGYALDGYAEDVIETCSGPWDLVVGHSLGGAVAVRAGEISPGFAQAYLLIDPAIDLTPATIAQLRLDLVAEAEHPPSVQEIVADHPRWHREDAVRKHTAVLATSPDVMAATFDDTPKWLMGSELSAIDAPIHILGAEQEPLYTTDDFERHTRPDSALTFEIVPNTAHSIYRDNPGIVITRALGLISS